MYYDLGQYVPSTFSDANLLHYKHEEARISALNISHHLAAYIAGVKAKDQIIQTLLTSALNTLVDNFSTFERVRNIPVPIAYSSLLKQIVMIYLGAIPFQIVRQIEWLTIPIVFLGALCLLNIKNIGSEIENPFGYDSNDLPMDAYCEELKVELTSLMSRTVKRSSHAP
ncbi:Bestrophin, RFP-TM, chloride channel-domain-containing protein [Cladochytrium replicatum]|nr:Bestrophin, RFP-TM, chloride channel-domain-containing protein [Cladochytrium replicatum]